MRQTILTLLLAVVSPMILSAHEFYISITNIQYHPVTEKLSVRLKIFVNDLEESIYQEKGVRVGLWKNNPIANAESYVAAYVNSKFSISVNGKPIPLNIISQNVESAEIVEDHIFICQLEAENVPKIKTIKVHNSLLTEAFDSQTNIVNIRANGSKTIINLNKIIPEEEVIYD